MASINTYPSNRLPPSSHNDGTGNAAVGSSGPVSSAALTSLRVGTQVCGHLPFHATDCRCSFLGGGGDIIAETTAEESRGWLKKFGKGCVYRSIYELVGSSADDVRDIRSRRTRRYDLYKQTKPWTDALDPNYRTFDSSMFRGDMY